MADPDEYKVGVRTPQDEADIATYPQDVQQLIRNIDDQEREDFRHYTEDYNFKVVDGIVSQTDKNGNPVSGWHGPITQFFSLSYASWLVLPRLTLQEMPLSWQARFVALLEEAEATGAFHYPVTQVTVIGENGKFRNADHWNNYRRGSLAEALETDKRLDAQDAFIKEAKRQQRLKELEDRYV